MDRPTVICHMLMALDGKIDGRFFSAPETRPALEKYGELRKFYDCPATIYGTTTMAEGYADGIVSDLPESVQVYPRVDYLADSGAASLFETGGFSASLPAAFALKGVEQIENDTLWLRYTAKG